MLMKQHHLQQQITIGEKTIQDRSDTGQGISQTITILEQSIRPSQPLLDTITLHEQQLEKRKNAYQNYRAQGNVLTSEFKNLTNKKRLTQDKNDPSCPLCEQNLTISRRRFLQQKFNRQEDALQHKIERFNRIIPKLK